MALPGESPCASAESRTCCHCRDFLAVSAFFVCLLAGTTQPDEQPTPPVPHRPWPTDRPQPHQAGPSPHRPWRVRLRSQRRDGLLRILCLSCHPPDVILRYRGLFRPVLGFRLAGRALIFSTLAKLLARVLALPPVLCPLYPATPALPRSRAMFFQLSGSAAFCVEV